jgi:hypothetical protein
MSAKVSPQSPQTANNANNPVPEPPMAYRYQRAYESLYSKLPEQMQARVLAVKGNISIADRKVDTFIKNVIVLAESDKEL